RHAVLNETAAIGQQIEALRTDRAADAVEHHIERADLVSYPGSPPRLGVVNGDVGAETLRERYLPRTAGRRYDDGAGVMHELYQKAPEATGRSFDQYPLARLYRRQVADQHRRPAVG